SSRPNIVASDNDAAAAPTAPVASDRAEKVPPASGYANIQPAAAPIALRGNVMALTARDSVSALGPLKVVGRPRQTGAKITLYEVTPTDTVTLTEFMNVQLESAVVTGMPAATPTRERVEAQAAGKAVAAPPPQRVDAAANGVTTVTWTDAASGNVLKLSGRLPLAQLQQIKIRIEKERAAAAAAAKKNP
ncbi:MAG TPA: hypothetical protein VKB91_10585, partial [Gemmatimonadaceae bacterium]|nr:hypothetical protein [Gemmatimonadaceae bacterium]